MQTLAQKAPGLESALAVARAAIDAQEFAVARAALAPLSRMPTQRVAMMMAELEEAEHGDDRPRPRMDAPRRARGARSGVDRGRLSSPTDGCRFRR